MNEEEFLKKNDELIEKYVHDKEKNKPYIVIQETMCMDFAKNERMLALFEALSNKYGDVCMYPCLCKHFLKHKYNWFTFYIRSLKLNIDFCVDKDTKDLMFQLWRTRNILLFEYEELLNIKDIKERIDFVITEIEAKIVRNNARKYLEENVKTVTDTPKVAPQQTKRKRIRIGEKVKY